VLQALDLGHLQLRLDRANGTLGDAVLEIENIAGIALETIGPDVRAGAGLNKLPRDAKPIARTPKAALQHIAHPELAPDLTHVDILALV
jgi:hypothetical protein